MSLMVEADRVCAPRLSEHYKDCARHSHLDGRGRLQVVLEAVGGSEEEWRPLLGQVLPLRRPWILNCDGRVHKDGRLVQVGLCDGTSCR